MSDKQGDPIVMLDEDELEPVTGGLGGQFVPGAQEGPKPSPQSKTGSIPAPAPSVSTADFGYACWKSPNMEHVFVINKHGYEACKYCGAARPTMG